MDDSSLVNYEIYTDGAHRNGVASWAYVVVKQPEDVAVHEATGRVENKLAVQAIWNIAGEIEAAVKAIKWAVDTNTVVTLISDYQGIQGWAKDWATNNEWSAAYAKYVSENEQQISEFRFVRGHSRNKWNDYVDELAYKSLSLKE